MESHMRSAQVGQLEMQLRSEFLRKQFESSSPTAEDYTVSGVWIARAPALGVVRCPTPLARYELRTFWSLRQDR
jgi:hypothetical protein